MFNVRMDRLKQPLANRGMTFNKNDDGTVTIDGKVFDLESEVEVYLEGIPRKDLPESQEKVSHGN